MKKILSVVLLASTLLTLSLPAISNQPPVLGVNRFMIQFDNAPGIPNIVDKGHAQMLSLGAPNNLYTQADADALDAQSFQFILLVVGLDFSKVEPVNGIRTISDANGPLAVLLPVFIGAQGNYNVLFDSSTDEIYKNNGNWTVRNSSNLMVYVRPGGGKVASGRAEGQAFEENDALIFGYTDQLLTNADWTKPQNRDRFIVSTVKPTSMNDLPPFMAPASAIGKQPINGFGQKDVHAAFLYCAKDSSGNYTVPGFGSDNNYFSKFIDSNGNLQQHLINHHVVTFLVNAQTPNPCPSVNE